MGRYALLQALARAGAVFADGGSRPLRFHDTDAEYRAATEAAGMSVRLDRRTLAVRGTDRAAWLQRMVSGDVRPLDASDGAVPACLLNPAGHVIADVCVVRAGDDLLLDVPAEARDRVRAILDGYVIMEDVGIAESDALATLRIMGPDADRWLPAASTDAATVIPMPGAIDVYVRTEEAATAWERLRQTGLTPIGSDVEEIVRVEIGTPLFGAELDERVLPAEAGLDATHISYTKGCYVGQEVTARLASRGHTNRALVGIRMDVPDAPVAGAAVWAAGAPDRECGRVTSAVISPRFGAIALAFLRHEANAPGAAVLVGESRAPGRVDGLPFGRRVP